jgi:hypothetical protein
VREERTNLFEKEREETQREDGYTTVLSTETDVSCVAELVAKPFHLARLLLSADPPRTTNPRRSTSTMMIDAAS